MAVKFYKSNKGISIIEIMIVVAIFVISITSLFGITAFSLKLFNLTKQTVQATNLSKEALEAVRNFRDGTDWNADGLGILTNGIAYHPEKTTDNPPKWQLIQDEETINGFTRKIVFEKVFRSTINDDISDSGTEDLKTKKVTVTVSWGDKKVETITYLTGWQ